MTEQQDLPNSSRKYFLLAGLLTGAAVSIWYLLKNRGLLAAGAVDVDNAWGQLFNVTLILIAALFQFSLLHKLAMLVMKLLRRGERS